MIYMSKDGVVLCSYGPEKEPYIELDEGEPMRSVLCSELRPEGVLPAYDESDSGRVNANSFIPEEDA